MTAVTENDLKRLEDLIKFVKTERQKEELNHSWIQNEVDNIEKLIYSTLYKLKNL